MKRRHRTRKSSLATRASSRRGVLLLVVLGMLTLFLMIGTAFVVSSNQYRRANKSYSKFSEKENLRIAQQDFLGEVINQLIRDTTNQNSALRFHSLLRDLYGTEGFRGEVLVPLNNNECVALAAKYAGAPGGTADPEVFGLVNKQFIEFAIYDSPNLNDAERPRDLFGNLITLDTMPDYYAGQVLTWTSGPMEGKSTRIVKSRYDANLGYTLLTVVTSPTTLDRILEPVRGAINTTRTPEITSLATASTGINFGATFVVNGRPFNGTGVGYDPNVVARYLPKLVAPESVPNPDGSLPAYPFALMPNPSFFMTDRVAVPVLVSPAQMASISQLPAAQQPAAIIKTKHGVGFDGLGGSDESYDAPDFQNMFLAWTGPNVADTIFTDLNGTPNPLNSSEPFTRLNPPPYLGNIVIPSFHRPALIHYWAHQFKANPGDPLANSLLGTAVNANMLRKVMLRPNWIDHPSFDGGFDNTEYHQALANFKTGRINTIDPLLRMIYGPWDVDNDNDGIRDSVWIDFGAPVMMGANGRLVKPLAAVLVVDMDGRLNVNAHGTRELADLNEEPQEVNFAGGVESDDAPRGQAFGVAEIKLNDDDVGVLDDGAVERLMRGTRHDWNNDGIFDEFIPGRYGFGYVRPSEELDDEPGGRNFFDLTAQLKMQGYPGTNSVLRNDFGSLPDLRARYSLGLNILGQAVMDFPLSDFPRLAEDNPYELDLSLTGPRGIGAPARDLTPQQDSPGQVDMPFTAAELERILRAYDPDAGSLSPRLYELLKGNQTSPNPNELRQWRALLTTDSYDVPNPGFKLPDWVIVGPDGVPGTVMPNGLVNAAGYDDYAYVMGRTTDSLFRRNPVNAVFSDLIEYRILLEIYKRTNPANPVPRNLRTGEEILLRNSMRSLIAPEMMAGLKLDLNRPFGNGRDDDGNGVVDEPGEFIDANGNGTFDAGEADFAFWNINPSQLSPNESSNLARTAFQDDRNNDVDGNPATNLGIYRDDMDRDGDGIISPAERALNNPTDIIGLVNLHNYRRQLLARYLYVIGMAVTDPLPPLDVAGLHPTIKNRKIKEYRRDVADRAEKMAQWAINVVDYRDADNIMTPFEYDAYPFATNMDLETSTSPYNTWGVDGDLRTSTDIPNWSDNGIDDPGVPSGLNKLIDREDPEELADRNGIDDDGDGLVDFADFDEVAERRLVWGMERPELVMTETLAWHDRATEDLSSPFDDPVNDENADGKLDEKDDGQVGLGGGNFDRDFDQMFRPQGATFIELYNPWGVSPSAGADTHVIDPNTGEDLGVDLAAVSIPRTIPGPERTSPVWRIDVRKTVDHNTGILNPQLALYVGGPDHDPDDPDQRVQPQIPDRCIYFTPFDPEQRYPIRAKPEFPRWETEWDEDGVAFYSSLTNPNAPVNTGDPSYIRNHAVVRPGAYMVVGSGIPIDAAGTPVEPTIQPHIRADGTHVPNPDIARYEAWIGDKKNTSPDQRHAIVLNPYATGAQMSVMVRSGTGAPLRDAFDTPMSNTDDFQVSATADTTSVAIIDSVWFRNINKATATVTAENWEYRRFSVSEPAEGYPLAVFGSDFRNADPTYPKGIYPNDPNGRYHPALDIPLDNQRWQRYQFTGGNIVDGQTIIGITSPKWMRRASMNDTTATYEIQKDNELRLTLPEKEERSVRTIPAFSWLYLQRLANPLLPWNPPPGHQKHRPIEPVNPYLTVDSMAVNVTAFTGRETSEKRVYEGQILDYGNSYAMQTFASLQRGRNNEAIVEALLGRIREAQGPVGEPSGTNGLPTKVTDTGFRNMSVNLAKSAGFVREPHLNGVAGGQPVFVSPQNLWGEERIGLVAKELENMDADLKKPFGVWLNRAGPSGDGLYKIAVSGSHYFHSLPDTTLGFLNEPYRTPDTSKSEFEKKFIPTQPFSLIAWNNRPFANSGELLQVPAFRSSQLPKVYSFSKGLPPAYALPAGDPDDRFGKYVENFRKVLRIGTYPKVLASGVADTDAVDSKVAFPEFRVDGPFGHLLNFFRMQMFHDVGSDSTVNTPDDRQWNQGFAGLHRVLDLVDVPSRYVGSETWLSPLTFGNTTVAVTSSNDPRYGLQPPFNKLSSLREPGKVNINTIAAESVWNGIFHGDADLNPGSSVHAGPQDNDLAASRRGYGVKPIDPVNDPDFNRLRELWKDPTALDASYPTLFANPFRHGDSGFLVPLDNMVLQGVDCTLHRHDPPIKGNDGQWGTANQDDNGNGIVDDVLEQGLGGDDTMPVVRQRPDSRVPFNGALTTANVSSNFQLGNMFRDSGRNPYFRYSPISRLSSMTTTRSNVFAVWVTVGFFEVTEADRARFNILHPVTGTFSLADQTALFLRVYPDGYEFGKEAGAETGQPVRYREFAIIDRTIPVGFEPGANHNVHETVRLRRRIE